MIKKINFGVLILLWLIGIWIIISMFLHNKTDNTYINVGHNRYFLLSLGLFSTYIFGYKYIKRCYFEIFKWKKLGMNFLVFLSTQTAICFSIYQFIINENLDLIEVTIFVSLFLQTGDLINDKLKSFIATDLKNILSIQPKKVLLIENNEEKLANTTSIKVGSIIKVLKNQIIPLDGKIISDEVLLNTQIIDGENESKRFVKNDVIFAGMLNLSEELIFKNTQNSFDSFLSKITMKVSSIQSEKSKLKSTIDMLITIFTPIVLLLSLIGFLVSYFWLNYYSFYESIKTLITVLVSACPCAIGIAIPLAIAIGSSKAAKQGVIFNKPDAFYKLANINVIGFDKTGTLTVGKVKVKSYEGRQNYLNIIALIEEQIDHPIANGFKNYIREINYETSKLEVKKIEDLKYKINSKTYELLPIFKYKNEMKSSINIDFKSIDNTATLLLEDNVVVAKIEFEDELRRDAILAVNKLKKQGYELVIVTGDNYTISKNVAKKLNIKNLYAEQSAEDKLNVIKDFQNQKKAIAYVGDGINDILAIQKADLSISILSKNAFLNLESDISLLNPNIDLIVESIKYAKYTKKIIFTNLFWAFIYNAIVLPLAIFAILTPFIGMIAMFFSTLLVLLNSLLFKLKK
ncbi:heavy metal translocating P-type ATPase [Spiroplasma tabanidicola]|uniref:Copper-transporting ATPase n=1 Tax=Spiroplasma tabanidicola TaxID=324079 RepID=A0A6I6CAE2_9MOLU|nr:heavy metal translocating P-type ATPase [Spiroplasma tabanidicola]QGS52429.1 copper-transporting ATPase [Spiroplasma tabanidicola]